MILQNKFGVISIESFNPYLNDYDANYLFPATSPRNLLSIPTINNKNWLPKAADYQRITVSSQDIDNAIENPSVSGNLGISTSVNSQRLIFSLNAPFSDISSSSSTANTEITDSAGLYIMTSNIFSQTEFTTIEFEDSYGFTDSSITVSTHTSSVADINYGLITFQASNSDGLLKAFDVRSTDKIFAFKPFTISQSCSVYSDSGNYDFYLVGADGVAGRLNQQTYNSYVLINVPCMTSSAFSGLHFSISNFWTGDSSTAGSLTGNMFPALLYISGKLSDSEAKNVKKLAIFLQNVEPFNSLQDYNDRNYVACSTSDVSPANCSGVINSNPDYYNYLTMNIIDFSIIDPSKQFSVIIPLKTIVNQLTISCFFATLGSSKDYPSNKPYYQILLASKRYSWRYYASPNALVFPFLITGLTNPNYGFDTSCSTCYPGNIVDTDLKIGHTDTGSTLTANDATNFAAGFTYVADENFLTANIAFTSIFSTSDNPCLTFRYSYDSTLAMKYGFFCPLQIGDIESSSKISISKIKLNFNEGSYMNGFGLFSLNNGNLASAIKSQGIIANKGTIKNHQFNPIIFKKGLIQARVYWSFQTTNPISNNNYIKFDLSRIFLNLNLFFLKFNNRE